MTPPRRQVFWTVWPLWVAASAVGNGLGAVASDWPLRMSRDVPSVPSMITSGLVVTGGLVMLTLPAILQWLVLRNRLPGAGWWIPASAVGKFLSFYPIIMAIARFTYPSPNASPFAAVTLMFLAGAVAGGMEWLVLRRRVSQAGWWVLARSIGLFGAIHVYSFVARGAVVQFFLGGLASGALSGAIAGLALVWLLRNPAERLRDDMRLMP